MPGGSSPTGSSSATAKTRALADRGMTMVIAAGETGLACEVADQVMCLDAGAVVESDPVNRISSPPGTIEPRRSSPGSGAKALHFQNARQS